MHLSNKPTKFALLRGTVAYSLDELMKEGALPDFMKSLLTIKDRADLESKLNQLSPVELFSIDSNTIKFGITDDIEPELVMESFIRDQYDSVSFVMSLLGTHRILDVAEAYKLVHILTDRCTYTVKDNTVEIVLPVKPKNSHQLNVYDELLCTVVMVSGFNLEFDGEVLYSKDKPPVKKIIIKTDGKNFNIKFKA